MTYVPTEIQHEFQRAFPKGLYSPTGIDERLLHMDGICTATPDDFENMSMEVMEFVMDCINLLKK